MVSEIMNWLGSDVESVTGGSENGFSLLFVVGLWWP